MKFNKEVFTKVYWFNKKELLVIKWNGTTNGQKWGIFSLVLALLVLPVSVLLALSPVKLFSRASYPITAPSIVPITIPMTPPPSPRITSTPINTILPKTPTPLPYKTASPSMTPSITLVPSTLPIPNNKPVISTNRLSSATVNRFYSQSVYGYDYDGDILKMYITNLPNGIIQNNCVNVGKWYDVRKGSNIRCTISGYPTSVGERNVRVTLIDSKGAFSEKYLILKVVKSSRFSF